MFKAVIKSNIKRYWWVFALNLAALTLAFIVPVLNENGFYPRSSYDFSFDYLSSLELLFGAVNGWCLFAYINSSRAVNLFHSLPSTRTSIFLANILCGGMSVILPNLGLAAILPGMVEGHYETISPETCFGYIFVNGVIVGLMAFALACFTVMFSGNAVAGKVFTPIIALTPMFLWGILSVMHTELLYGSNGLYIDLPFELDGAPYEVSETEAGITVTFWAALILIAVLLAGAYIAFRRRQMESAGEVVTVKWAKVLFIQGSALCFGELLTDIVFQKWTGFLPLIGFGLIAAAAAMMILQKTYRIKGYLKQAIAYVCIVGVIYAVFAFDITGYERRVPDPSRVESVTLNFSQSGYFAQIEDFTDPAFIKTVTEAHRKIVKDRPEARAYNDFYLTYKLKNGRHMERHYKLPYDELEKYLGDMMMSDLYKNHAYSLDEEWLSVSFRENGNPYNINREKIPALKAALAKDVAEGDFEALFGGNNAAYDEVSIDLNISLAASDGDAAETDKTASTDSYEYYEFPRFNYITVSQRLPNVWACLMELKATSLEEIGDAVYCYDGDYSTAPAAEKLKQELQDNNWVVISATEGWGYPYLSSLSRNFTDEEETMVLYSLGLDLTDEEKAMTVCTVRASSPASGSTGDKYIFVTLDEKSGEVYDVEYWFGGQKLEDISSNEILNADDERLTWPQQPDEP